MTPRAQPKRAVVWFSCGATSAVAAKIACEGEYGELPVRVVYCDPGSEHPDNLRFLRDVEEWAGASVTVLRSDRYKDTWEVFEKRRYLSGPDGALCTYELKKRLAQEFRDVGGDVEVYGFDAGEMKRAANFRTNNPEVDLRTPLIDRGLTKPDCLAMLQRAGIELPAMYRLGFGNANCIGCVKGQMGYWNRIRRVFPETFSRMAKLERTLGKVEDGKPRGAAICKSYAGDKKRKRVFLDELDPDAGRDDEPVPECGLLCAATEREWE